MGKTTNPKVIEMDEREREQFEAWARTCDGNCNDRDIERRSDGDYHNMLVQRDWDVWQASRAALAPAQPIYPGWISEHELAKLLPDPYYMDPPDGGSVTVLEQLQRMAQDAARWRLCWDMQYDLGSCDLERIDDYVAKDAAFEASRKD